MAGRYRLLEHIGRGGMGTVWLARDEILGRQIAVKELIAPPELTGPEREIFTARTFREARAAGRVSHAGVATVYDVFEENGHPWIVMQFVPSDTLGAVVRDQGPLPPDRVARIGLELLGALRAAHKAGVLHRDVKPDNVLLDKRDGRAVLTDFGIAMLDDDSPVTRTGTLIGTPAFMAPERAEGGQATRASDLWSLGVTLYVAVEGRSPFQRGNPLATLGAVMHDPPAPMRRAGALAPVLAGLLRKDPAQRLTAAEAERSLRMVAEGLQPEPTAPAAVPVPAPRRPENSGPVPVAAPVAAPQPSPVPPRRPAGGRGMAVAGLTSLILSVGLVAGGLAWVLARTQHTAQTPTVSPTVRVTVSVTPTAEPSTAEPVTRRSSGGGTTPRRYEPPSSQPSRSTPQPTEQKSGKPDKTDKPDKKDRPSPSPKPTGSNGGKKNDGEGENNTVPPADGPDSSQDDPGGAQDDPGARNGDDATTDGVQTDGHAVLQGDPATKV
ncbi:serine/threonine-protein kinase [Sphaerisporangium krabiense]|uniref:non-specific serine/threonine protein kinase n=1 Tax=Sphaerisporangium krabiense TaxID=763782 RepID=A0A7W9DS93_9ACTN|nr:serine/threonine-protein kinase [Sphaerisporangium krabiense]MBB5629316.1 serine/threonine protein kinase [Sphaerisporangium krabiense]